MKALQASCLLTLAVYVLSMGSSHAEERSTPAQQEGLYPKSVALVIGVNEAGGAWPPLSSAEEDASRFARHLRRRGFEVTLLLGAEASKQSILRELQTSLPQRVKAEDRFILYFAGHGQTQVTAKGTKVGYIVPSDGVREAETDHWHTYVSMRELTELLTQHMNSKHSLLLFDSCFSGMMFTRGGLRRPNLGSRAHLKLKGVMGLTAGSDQELAREGLFTPILLQALSGEADTNQDDVISFQELALYARQEIKARHESQNPQFGIISGNGQMLFESEPGPILSEGGAELKAELNPLPMKSAERARLTWTLSGALMTALGAGLVAHGLERYDELNEELEGVTTEARFRALSDERFGSISAEYSAGWIVGGAGLIALSYGLYQWAQEGSSPSSGPGASSVKASAQALSPLFGPRSFGLSYSW